MSVSQASLLRINGRVSIRLSELSFRASRSGGPGGQHVNTSSTRVELWWDAAASPSLSEIDRALVLARLAPRLQADGRLRLVSGATRSQSRNRELAIERFRTLLTSALVRPKVRKRTRPSPAAKERRLARKRRRAETKLRRLPPRLDE